MHTQAACAHLNAHCVGHAGGCEACVANEGAAAHACSLRLRQQVHQLIQHQRCRLRGHEQHGQAVGEQGFGVSSEGCGWPGLLACHAQHWRGLLVHAHRRSCTHRVCTHSHLHSRGFIIGTQWVCQPPCHGGWHACSHTLRLTKIMAEPPHTQPLPPWLPLLAAVSLTAPTAWPRHWPRSRSDTTALILALNQPLASSFSRAAPYSAALGLAGEHAAAAAHQA